MKSDAYGEVNQLTFEYSQQLKESNIVPSIDFGPSRYADAPPQLSLRACHERYANKRKMEGLSQEPNYLRKKVSDGETEEQ